MAHEYDHERQHVLNHKYDCLLFDYMINQLGIEESKVLDMCYVLYTYYGTTMAGLRAIGYNFDHDHFHSLVHGRLPYDLLKPDLGLRNLLLRLPFRRVVFTNADKRHASEVLKRLGLEDCFESIICFETLNSSNNGEDDDMNSLNGSFTIFNITDYQPSSGVTLPATPILCKPFELAFERAFKIADIDPGRTLFFDDSVRNVTTAKRLGLHTVLVGKPESSNAADYALESVHDIREAFPELLEEEEEMLENGKYSQEMLLQA
ncbi:hypothetical protein RND81_04G164000 [Saponaria officinalis]|uniref:Uncharacterized protein n=1 Tax=Saponaria officinalis TaxID=3572 RepID=A0AAW1LLG1_SAPOF